MAKDRRLGRGLAALLGEPIDENPTYDTVPMPSVEPPKDPVPDAAASDVPTGVVPIDLSDIDENPFQPRRDFSETEIVSLAESLKEHDMLQPVLVRPQGNRYQLISGERRLRAAIQAGWSTIPARIRDADDRLVAELAIVENLQRKDLNPIEKALSFRRYLDQHGCTQDDLAKRLKIDRSTIANLVRLLELPDEVIHAVSQGQISAGHARALLTLGEELDQIEASARIQSEGLSVRATERLVQDTIHSEDGSVSIGNSTRPTRRAAKSEQISSLEQEFRMALGTKVDLKHSASGRGRITIHFTNHDEFERLRALLGDSEESVRKTG